jgi:ribonuclease P protein component
MLATIKASNQYFLLLAKPNGLASSRLGLVIAKKNVRLAVQRNRIKRIVRETFRLHRAQPAIDIVVLARRGLDTLDGPELHSRFGKLLQELQAKAKRKFTTPG